MWKGKKIRGCEKGRKLRGCGKGRKLRGCGKNEDVHKLSLQSELRISSPKRDEVF